MWKSWIDIVDCQRKEFLTGIPKGTASRIIDIQKTPFWPHPEGSVSRTIKGELGQPQGFVGCRQIGRPFLDAQFQLYMRCVKRLLRELVRGDVCNHPLHTTHLPVADNELGRAPYQRTSPDLVSTRHSRDSGGSPIVR